MIALLDGDIFCYRVGFTTEEEEVGIAKWRIDEMIQECLDAVQATEYKVFITGSNNFRYDINPTYKANRSDKPKPKHLPALREHLVTKWKAEVAEGMEADDLLAIDQTDDSIICTIDKDLLQVPGKHYNFVKKEFQTIGTFEGLIKFYTQFLVGDKADNIIGIDRMGPVKSEAYLKGCRSELELFDRVRQMYNDDERFLMNGRCLYMKRTLEDDWINKYNELKEDLDRG